MLERIIMAAILALIITLILGPILIPVLRVLKFGQNIREEGPKSHLAKAGTPTMGGIIFLVAIVVSALVMAEKPTSLEMIVLVSSMLGFGLIGFVDDFIKVVMGRNLGLRAYQKLIGQFALAFLLTWVATQYLGRGTDLVIPFTSIHLDFGFFYYPFVAFIIVGITNAVNLTDGLDGLAAGSTFFSFLSYIIIALLVSSQGGRVAILAHESDLAVFAAAALGGCLGFLRFNKNPARIFMGDTGSLALGGALVGLAIITKTELILLLIGGVYVVEAFSVIIQVISYQTTGKRVFRMSPLHHHFELGGWSEWKVVIVFWLASLLCGILGIAAFMGGIT
ncbi:MAG: phospho-N-acetylmuramoyl-pentapeptide-transferase [Desulfitobacterium sp.]|nr:phospho-N-acetylmuramoyl-pentapeptide-transferase [Desulfitobacterium sp.]